MSKFLKSALWYQKQGYSVIPVKRDKKPYIKWEKYQSERANQDQIRTWWEKWPGANIGLVTGKVSGIDVTILTDEEIKFLAAMDMPKEGEETIVDRISVKDGRLGVGHYSDRSVLASDSDTSEKNSITDSLDDDYVSVIDGYLSTDHQ